MNYKKSHPDLGMLTRSIYKFKLTYVIRNEKEGVREDQREVPR